MDLNNIVNHCCFASRNNNYSNELELVKDLKQAIELNQDLLLEVNQIELLNNNGREIDFDHINKIIDKYSNSNVLMNRVINIDDNTNYIYSNTGVLLVLFDGNLYTMLEMIILGILTHNTMIFAYEKGSNLSNGILTMIVSALLDKFDLNKDTFQYIDKISDDLFKINKSINKTVIIGNNDFINKYLKKCSTDVFVSGYRYYDIYLDSSKYLPNVEELSSRDDVNIYVNGNINTKMDSIVVNDIDEAITMINYNSSLYCSSIFTENKENASKFTKSIKSKNIYVNSDPIEEKDLDIKQENLLRVKKVKTREI